MKSFQVTLREWETVGPGTKRPIPELSGFRFSSEQDRRLAEKLSRKGTLTFVERHDGLQIAARAHVGRLQLGPLTLSVVPKTAARDLLTLVRYAYGLRKIELLAPARQSVTGDLLQDLLITQLYSEARTLLDRGLARAYVARAEDLASPRGQIDFSRLAQRAAQATAQLPCRHYLRDSDHLLNRVLLAGVRHARCLAQDPTLRMDLARLQTNLSELAETVPISASLLSRARRKLDRMVAPYASVLRLIELLYFGNQLDLLEDEVGSETLPGFLFDMNRFFQELLQRFLADNLPVPFQLEPEHRLADMLRYVPGENPRGRRAPTPRPDYAIRHGRNVVALLDAKYRDLWNTQLPRDMLYQLSIYALSQPRGATAAILYPASDPEAKPARIEIRDPLRQGIAGYVALRPVLLSRMVALLADREATTTAERREFASNLAGVRVAERSARAPQPWTET